MDFSRSPGHTTKREWNERKRKKKKTNTLEKKKVKAAPTIYSESQIILIPFSVVHSSFSFSFSFSIFEIMHGITVTCFMLTNAGIESSSISLSSRCKLDIFIFASLSVSISISPSYVELFHFISCTQNEMKKKLKWEREQGRYFFYRSILVCFISKNLVKR